MKTISKISKILLVAFTFVFTTTLANAQERIMVHMGIRVPQMNTEERTKIGAERHLQHARGQVIFNTDTEMLEYWSGERWVGANESDSVLQYILENFPQQIVDTVMANVSVIGERGLVVTRSGAREIKASLPEGQRDGQILTWDNELEVWRAMAPAQTVRQLTIPVLNGTFTTENLIFHGKTSASTSPLQVLGIEPIFEDAQLRRMFLRVDATVENSSNTAEWTVSIENRNFSPDNTFVLTDVVISYISADDANLIGGAQSLIQIAGF